MARHLKDCLKGTSVNDKLRTSVHKKTVGKVRQSFLLSDFSLSLPYAAADMFRCSEVRHLHLHRSFSYASQQDTAL